MRVCISYFGVPKKVETGTVEITVWDTVRKGFGMIPTVNSVKLVCSESQTKKCRQLIGFARPMIFVTWGPQLVMIADEWLAYHGGPKEEKPLPVQKVGPQVHGKRRVYDTEVLSRVRKAWRENPSLAYVSRTCGIPYSTLFQALSLRAVLIDEGWKPKPKGKKVQA